jgi:hypothetical protein
MRSMSCKFLLLDYRKDGMPAVLVDDLILGVPDLAVEQDSHSAGIG